MLGLSGGIACYKAAELVRELVKAGATVQVVMTEAAEHFITAVTLQALSNRPVFTSQWDARDHNNMAHINLTENADKSCEVVTSDTTTFNPFPESLRSLAKFCDRLPNPRPRFTRRGSQVRNLLCPQAQAWFRRGRLRW